MKRAGIPRRLLRTFFAVLLLLPASGCQTGRMLMANVELEKLSDLELTSTPYVVGIRSLERLESNPYQDQLELELERSLHHSGLFRRVVRDDFQDADVDWVLRVEKADLSYRRQANLAYFPLAFATLTLYIWVGGPIWTDVSFFDLTLHVDRPDGTRVSTISTTLQLSHWMNLYSMHRGVVCDAPKSHRLMALVLEKLDGVLRRQASIASGAES